MNSRPILLAVITSCLFYAAGKPADATLLFIEDFEDAAVSYTTSVPEFSDGQKDFYTRIGPGSPNTIAADVIYNNISGSGYFAGMDLDGEGGPPSNTMTFSNIDIAGYRNLTFSGLFAEDDNGTNQDWDSIDSFMVQAQIDGGGYFNVFAIESSGGTNTEPAVDTNFDGIGDGTRITDTFTQFMAAIAGTGNLLDLQLILSVDSAEEDLGFDNISISGDLITNGVPEPHSLAMLSVLAAFAGVSRFRRRNTRSRETT